MTKSPSFWPGQWIVAGACAKAAEAAVSSRAVAKARKVIGILQVARGRKWRTANRRRRPGYAVSALPGSRRRAWAVWIRRFDPTAASQKPAASAILWLERIT